MNEVRHGVVNKCLHGRIRLLVQELSVALPAGNPGEIIAEPRVGGGKWSSGVRGLVRACAYWTHRVYSRASLRLTGGTRPHGSTLISR